MRTALRSVSRAEGLGLLGLVLAGLALRIALWSTQSLVTVDGTTYIRLADWLAGGPAFESVQPFGYPILIRVAYLVIEDRVLAARMVTLVSGVALIPLVWMVSRRLGHRGILALLPAAALAFLPVPVRYSITTLSETPYLVCLLLGVYWTLGQRPFRGGLLGGLAYAIRPEALFVVAGLALRHVRRWRLTLRLVLGAAAVILAYMAFQGAFTGSWDPARKAINIASDTWWLNEARVGGEEAPGTLGRLRLYGPESVQGYPARAGRYGLALLRHGGWITVPIALAGLRGAGLGLAAGFLPLVVAPFFAAIAAGHARFIFPALPFLWLLTAHGLARIPAGRRRYLGILVAVLGLAGSATLERRGYVLPEDGTFPELVQVGEWLRPHVTPETVVYDRKPYTAFFARATPRTIPIGGYDETLDAIVAAGGDYLVIDQTVVEYFRPELLPLALDKGVIRNEPRLKAVHTNFRYQGRKTILYRVVRPDGPDPLPGPEATALREYGYLDHWPNHYVHGILALRREAWSVAAGEFTLAIRADSTRADACNNLAWSLARMGKRLEEAESWARRALDLDPGNPDYRDTLIEVLEVAGKTGAAREEREREASGDAPPGGD